MEPEVGDIMVTLYARFADDSFHWGLTVKKSNGYAVFHATNSRVGFWRYESDTSGGETAIRVVTSTRLAAFVKIGKPFKHFWTFVFDKINQSGTIAGSEWTIGTLDEVFKVIPMATDHTNGGRSIPFDCKIWIKMALQKLNVEGLIACPDASATMKECEDFGSPTYSVVNARNTTGNWAYFVSETSSW